MASSLFSQDIGESRCGRCDRHRYKCMCVITEALPPVKQEEHPILFDRGPCRMPETDDADLIFAEVTAAPPTPPEASMVREQFTVLGNRIFVWEFPVGFIRAFPTAAKAVALLPYFVVNADYRRFPATFLVGVDGECFTDTQKFSSKSAAMTWLVAQRRG